jgi:hypothetical protein
MNAFLHFIINNEIIHRFWDSVSNVQLRRFVVLNIIQKKKVLTSVCLYSKLNILSESKYEEFRSLGKI